MSRKTSKQEKDTWTSFVQLVQTYAETSVLKTNVEKVPKDVIENTYDDRGMDLLHYAIIANNTEAVSLLFHKGFFKPPHEFHSFPYVHLAARLGHKTILGLLLQERPNDNQPEAFSYKTKSDQARTNFDDHDREKKTPLDLAGKHGHLKCVNTILDHYQSQSFRSGKFKGNEDYIEMTCKLDSPHALRLLLSQSPTEEEIKKAVGAALKNARPECLDVLLRLKTNLSSLFEGMNLYHVLYSYSLSFDKKWYERLLAVTTVKSRKFEGIALHGYLKLIPRVGLEEKMVLALLRHGADPDCYVDGHYPITIFVDSLLQDLGRNNLHGYSF
ncbi:hypothetical protein FSP39_008394 [Pinctada imbricata]|uniref:Uncharacterized protein n=1 Tax=Pinctada imbricata TaxID=66713 RepID=A0AA89C6W0_PINIB|nr:hypothetical protein FSP39_008394 [Pinctada imbricata]